MSQITRTSLTFSFLLLLSVFTLAGCGSSNSSSDSNSNSSSISDSSSQPNFNASTGKHAAGWLPAGHKPAAVANPENCAPCHGADYKGGISKVSCTLCHIGNRLSVHPAAWGPFTNVLHANFVRSSGTSTCANASCHGAALTGISKSGPSCTICHLGGAASVHPPWGTPDYAMHGNYVKNKSYDTSGCANTLCHGAQLNGTGGTGPSCTSCHMGGVALMHPPWGTPAYITHRNYLKNNGNNTSGCANAACHGTTLAGVSGSGPSCASCHLGGVASIHPPWGTPSYALHGTYVQTSSSNTSGCANAACHGSTLTGVSGSGPSCTLCHIGSAVSVHPVEWKGDVLLHKTKIGFTNIESCKNIVCHGAALEGVYLSGPSCYICH